MGRTRHGMLALAGVTVAPAFAVAQPDVTRMSGTLQAGEATAGRFTLRSPEGTRTACHAPAGFLSPLRTGDVVEGRMAGPNAMIMRTQDDASPLVGEDPRPQSPPDVTEQRLVRPPPEVSRPGP